MKFIALIALVLAASISLAQDDKSGLTKPKEVKEGASRMERIEAAMTNRIIDQSDEWFGKGDYPRAIAGLKFRIEFDPQDYEAQTDYIWMLGNIRDKEAEIAAAKRYHEMVPDDPDAWFPEGQIYFMRRDYVKAIPPLAKACSFDKPAQPNAYRLLAQCYKRQKMFQKAIDVWERMLKHFPNDAAAKKNLEQAKLDLAGGGKKASV